MECKVAPLLDRVAGRLLCPDGLPMLSMQPCRIPHTNRSAHILFRDGTVPIQTADHSLQDQPVFWIYLTEHRDWSAAVLPFQPEQRHNVLCS
jgi:hypothetical protein